MAARLLTPPASPPSNCDEQRYDAPTPVLGMPPWELRNSSVDTVLDVANFSISDKLWAFECKVITVVMNGLIVRKLIRVNVRNLSSHEKKKLADHSFCFTHDILNEGVECDHFKYPSAVDYLIFVG